MCKFRRPLPTRSSDIGMWGNLINFLTYLGIITNPLLVILTTSWGSTFDTWTKFVIFIAVEHVVFSIRMLVAFAVPDVPKKLLYQQQVHKLTKDLIQSTMEKESKKNS